MGRFAVWALALLLVAGGGAGAWRWITRERPIAVQTVTVAQRLPNGNLLVRGEKNIMINQGTEFVRIEGIVRPVDISPANTVQSYKVANASISYGSRGAINSANSKSWLARFFDSKWMPF